ncbi:MAG: acyl-CoA thioesterase [Alistipes sp.]|jgi:acyl-CoA thioester hydrolase|nr:acyl-CoA thioesterase [Alistipes sp.]
MISFETKIRVEYHHTDQMGVVHHSNYVKFFEVARTEWLRANGLTYAEMERRGVMMPIVDVAVKYRNPALYDELLSVTAFVDEAPMARMTFRYEVRGEDGRDIASGSTTLGFIDKETRRPVRAPQWLLEVIKL